MKAKYEKPKILLLDMSEKCESTLRDAGYNVSVGTFGRPYLVPKSDSAFFVSLETCELPNSEEQEVIVANTASPEAANDEPSEEPGEGVSAIWQSGDHGKIDPRPLAMMDVRDAFDRVLAHGGIAVVMLSRRYDVRYIMGSASEYRRFRLRK